MFHGDIYIFTDGSCFNQQLVNQRFAGYAVVLVSCTGVYDCRGSEVLDAGHLPGICRAQSERKFLLCSGRCKLRKGRLNAFSSSPIVIV